MPNFVPNFIKKSMKRLHFLIILSFITIFSSAEPYCDVRKFSILDGLAANSISDLAQGYDNMMWFGTWNGLSYYDGYHFKTFRDEPDDIDIMSTNRILSIFPSPDNNVWVVTFDRKLYIFDTEQCQFIKVGTMLCQRFGIHLESSEIYPLANGHTWITTHKQNFEAATYGLSSKTSEAVNGFSPTREHSSTARTSIPLRPSSGSEKWATPSSSPRLMARWLSTTSRTISPGFPCQQASLASTS
jgi:ligand-binding sensor domain-containing protein